MIVVTRKYVSHAATSSVLRYLTTSYTWIAIVVIRMAGQWETMNLGRELLINILSALSNSVAGWQVILLMVTVVLTQDICCRGRELDQAYPGRKQ